MRVWDFGNPTVTRNKFHSGRTLGLLVYEFGKGVYTDNEVSR